ncbi:MAG: chemotaxis response regulator protein-glutamate methylesterase [Bdellovibrionales bacterium RIFOXYB1_FULL_37_110]|nr:MAG: chemotaxis response regulator protein-glutamate methylesterase [Bdellovibrionales bacterium RIFOXYC1_FULL_37_79]OFZ57792.1 MAG: chemotaxis response regulator protein-glutamate methylesterase [Bdellovibrionales bacterium RIFOXYB1_FULL_37_110]OFZ62758.1 MAG: chemotaxis response regulator protein-glutamate methylesterase [Bdellovibrionales bacterium RIFOXYD1_FULL_36_51]
MVKKVLIIDDSALIREVLSNIINSFPEYEVVGTAPDPHVGAEKIMTLKPDVITLDVEMPKMDGLTFLEKLMRLRPMPVLLISSLTAKNSHLALKGLELGAVDYIHKPTAAIKDNLKYLHEEIKDKLDACVTSKVKQLKTTKLEVEKKYSTDEVLLKKTKKIDFITTEKVIAIGASTGGTVALSKLLPELPSELPGIVVVQHMPEGFTRSFAQRLNNECQMLVKEAEDNDTILSGQILIAPGNRHMLVERSGTRYYVRLNDGQLVNRHKPSVDVLYRSVSQTVGPNALGIILTGMGDDGANGLLEMKDAGAYTLGQDEKSSTVYGMPKVAFERGGVAKQMSLEDIKKYLINKNFMNEDKK